MIERAFTLLDSFRQRMFFGFKHYYVDTYVARHVSAIGDSERSDDSVHKHSESDFETQTVTCCL
jgi:hypothetical protein